MDETTTQAATSETLAARISARGSVLAAERAAHASVVDRLTKENDQLRASHERLRQELELLRRRIFIAKAERIDSTQLEMEFAQKLAALDALSGQISDETK